MISFSNTSCVYRLKEKPLGNHPADQVIFEVCLFLLSFNKGGIDTLLI